MAMPATLVIETSTPLASIARVDDGGRIEQRSFFSDRNHNAMLFGPLQELLDGTEIGLVLVGSGPGSYSGTRVGIAAAQGVAMAMECPAVALPSLLAVVPAENGAACLAIGDARRGSYWTARVQHLSLAHAPSLCDAEGFKQVVGAAWEEGLPVFSFEETERYPLPAGGGKLLIARPDATRLWHAWQAAGEAARNEWSAALPQPLYLKPPHITPGKRPPLVRS